MVASGRIELTTSPYYHPILPLLCNTLSAREARPDLTLPEILFRAPEDAVRQVENGLRYFEAQLGFRPRGMWPSEQSVSPEVLELLAGQGLTWGISDEGVLAKTLGLRFVPPRSGRSRQMPRTSRSKNEVCGRFWR